MPPKRKIALFSTSFLSYSQTFVYDEIMAHSENYEIDVFCKDRKNRERFPYTRYHKPPNKFAEIIYQNIAYWPSFDKVFKEKKFDLIHAHFGTGAVYALPYVKKYKLPFIVTFHGNDVAALMGNQKYHYSRWRYNFKAKQIFDRADLLLAASTELKALLIELGANPNKVQVYRLGIDLSKFEYSESKSTKESTTFTMVGRFTKKKGHSYALEAFKMVVDQGFDAHLSLIGSGVLEKDLKTYIAESNLKDRVHFKGVMSPEEVSKELKKSDILIAPSVVTSNNDRESGLIVVKEASASGRPVIGTWHGGIYEIIDDGVTGFLVPERNPYLLSEKMIALIKEPVLRNKFGNAGRKKMEVEYDLRQQILKLEDHYENALNGKK